MKYSLIRFIGLAFLAATLTAPAPAFSAGLEAPAVSPPAYRTFKEKLMSWDQTLLGAHIFLGRLPTAMPGSEKDTPERIALGQKLYFERGISLNKNKSCNDCHFLTQGHAGADVTPTSTGATGISGKRNAPTVINAGFHSRQ
jgi:cytochrome c peroxidase